MLTSKELAEILKLSECSIWKYSFRLGIEKARVGSTRQYLFSIEDAESIAKHIDRVHANFEKRTMLSEYLAKQNEPEVKEVKKYERMYALNEFPRIDSYEFLTECNTVVRNEISCD